MPIELRYQAYFAYLDVPKDGYVLTRLAAKRNGSRGNDIDKRFTRPDRQQIQRLA